MDGLPGGLGSLSLADNLFQAAEEIAQQRRQSEQKKGPYSVLVKEDGLLFRVLSATHGEEFSSVLRSARRSKSRALAQTFRATFRRVWGRLPEQDRYSMLAYWRNGKSDPCLRDPDPFAVPTPCPLIEIVDVGPWSPAHEVCSRFGSVLNFPASLVATHWHLLPCEIARALALVYRYASRQHWGLILDLIETPLDCWERRQGNRVTDALRNKKLDELEKEFLRQYEAQVAELLSGWGFKEPAEAAKDGNRQKGTAKGQTPSRAGKSCRSQHRGS
jgi:hypothetical protein